MIDNDIIKAFECCSAIDYARCNECLYSDDCEKGGNAMLKNALDLITRQKAEIESFKSELGICHVCGDIEVRTKTIDDYYAFKKTVRDREIKEFVERLRTMKRYVFSPSRQRYQTCSTADGKFWDFAVLIEDIDNLVKEMTGGEE